MTVLPGIISSELVEASLAGERLNTTYVLAMIVQKKLNGEVITKADLDLIAKVAPVDLIRLLAIRKLTPEDTTALVKMGATLVRNLIPKELALTESYARLQELFARYETAFKKPHGKVETAEQGMDSTRELRFEAMQLGVPLPYPTPPVLRTEGMAAAATASNAPDCAVAAGGAGCAAPAPAAALAAAASAPPPPPPPGGAGAAAAAVAPLSNAPDFEPAPPPPAPSKSNAPSLDGGRRRRNRTRLAQKKRRSARKTLRRRR
jgi:hypothetical protein